MRREILFLVALSVLMGAGAVYGFNPNKDTSLVGWWKLDDGQGTTAVDSSGMGNNGTLVSGPTWVDGRLKGALEFNGTNSYVDCGNGASLNLTSQVTVAAWVYCATPMVAQQVWVWKGNNAYGLKETWTAGGASFCIFNAGAWYEAAASPGLTDSDARTWIHWAGTYDGAAAKVYRNGALAGSVSYAGSIASTTVNLNFGQGSGSQQFFSGRLDDVRVYNRALTLDEITAVVNVINVPEGVAANPNPKDKATDVPRETSLSWTPGPFAGKHNVYLGTNFADVNTAGTNSPLLVGPGQDANTYDPPGRLDFGQTYYWRIDEVNATADHYAFRGDVWQFTVEPVVYKVTGITATASSALATSPAQNSVNDSGMTGDLASTDESATQWLTATNPTKPVSISYDLGAVYKLAEMWVWNSNS
ncbi:MAG: LamG domain-containing protein [Sedimentisphaerales bacterium]